MHRTVRYLLILLVTPVIVSAQIGGSKVFTFLDLPLSARINSLGGKVLSINDDDINLAVWNPALLNKNMSNQLAMSFADHIADTKYGYAGYAYHVNDKIGTFSAQLTRLNYGKFQEADIYGNIIGEFSATETAFNLGWAHPLDSLLTFGANLKYLASNYYITRGTGIAADFGLNYYKPSKNLSAALLVRNVGSMLHTFSEANHEKLPFEIEAGISKKPLHVPFRFSLTLQHLQQWDLTYTDPNNPPQLVDPLTGDSIKTSKVKTFSDKLARHIVVGGEFLLSKNFNLRFGYNYMRRKELLVDSKRGLIGFSFGLGFRIYKFHFSYGHSAYHIAGGTNTFTISTSISDFYHRN